jgi:hypothetical protein
MSSVAALISIAAAIYSARQAAAAKRQADAAHGDVEPTFHLEPHEDNGRPPWGFRIIANNYNRRPLRIVRVRVTDVPTDLLVWEHDHADADRMRNIIDAVMRTGEATFDVGVVLGGIAPNASQPTHSEHDFHVGFKGDAPSQRRRTVHLNVHVDWAYATGDRGAQTATLPIDLPIGRD